MKNVITEQSVLLLSVVKWVFLASIVGILVGASTAIFLDALGISTQVMSSQPYYFLALPLAFVASSLLVSKLAPEAEGHGTEKVIEAIHKKNGKISPSVIPVKLCATVITLATGGSAGKEGPCAQIGAGIASLLADIFSFSDNDRKKIVICGISAGFATVFGTPIAGAVFGVEVLVVGGLFYTALLPSLIAGLIGFQTAIALGIKYPSYQIAIAPNFGGVPMLEVIGAGIFFGIIAFIFIEVLRYFHRLSQELKLSKSIKALIGGASVALIGLLFSTAYLGLGLGTIYSAVQGESIAPAAAFLKILATSITLNFGGSGGIVTPIFFIGSTAGSLYAQLLGLNLATFAAIGFVSLLAAATNAPIAAILMSIELFGPAIAPFAAISCIVSYVTVGHRSVYPSQLLNLAKSDSLELQGNSIDDPQVRLKKGKRLNPVEKKLTRALHLDNIED